MAKVSVIVPIYNVEMYLNEALDSLQQQTLKDIEIICINDGSKDNSLAIMREYAKNDNRFVIIDKENGGYGKGMNSGLDRATGEYIGILEPDDYVPLNMYEDLYEIAKKHNLDMVKADFYRFTTDENTQDVHMIYNHLDSTHQYYNQVLCPRETPIVTKFIMNTWSGIYKRSFIEEHHIRHNETPGASFQDNGFFWQTFMHANRAMFIDKPYYRNRRDNPNSSVNSREKVYCMNIEYDYIKDIFMQPENRELWEMLKGYYNLKRYHNYMFTINRISDEYKKEYVNRISEEFKRSEQLDELDLSIFTPDEREKIAFLMKNPEDFYLKHVLRVYPDPRLLEDSRRLQEIQNSTTFKVGKVVMFIPISIKKGIIKLMK